MHDEPDEDNDDRDNEPENEFVAATSNSTGLTPVVSRTGLRTLAPPSRLQIQTPQRPGARKAKTPATPRRHSTPADVARINLHSDNHSPDDCSCALEDGPEVDTPARRNFVFLPFHDIIDGRTIRRLRRTGLSEAMNVIEQKKKEQLKEKKEVREEVEGLRNEINALKRKRGDQSPESEVVNAVQTQTPINDRIPSVEQMAMDVDDVDDLELETPVPARTASAQVQTGSPKSPLLKRELTRLKAEKQTLFTQWRYIIAPTHTSSLSVTNERQSSPPPEFFDDIVTTLRAVIAGRARALNTLKEAQVELNKHGFVGPTVSAILTDMAARFRIARLDLEHAVPGETAAPMFETGHEEHSEYKEDGGHNICHNHPGSLSDWRGTLDALVRYVTALASDLQATRHALHSQTQTNSALLRHFNGSLARADVEARARAALQDACDAMAADTLHLRTRLAALDREAAAVTVDADAANAVRAERNETHEDISALETDKTRLAQAAERWRAEADLLLQLNEQLEREMERRGEEVADLRAQVGIRRFKIRRLSRHSMGSDVDGDGEKDDKNEDEDEDEEQSRDAGTVAGWQNVEVRTRRHK